MGIMVPQRIERRYSAVELLIPSHEECKVLECVPS